MPKRIVEGEGIWLSDKIARLPEKFRAEYANILPLAMADGIFECDPRRVWCTVYAYNRPEVTVEYVEQMLTSMEEVGLICRGEHEAHKWAFFIGIDKPGRLPEPSKRGRYATSGLHPDIVRTMFGQALQSVNGNGNLSDNRTQHVKLGRDDIKRIFHEQSAKNKAVKKTSG